jgi:hypothetical protein
MIARQPEQVGHLFARQVQMVFEVREIFRGRRAIPDWHRSMRAARASEK